jgi:hypothetical protein
MKHSLLFSKRCALFCLLALILTSRASFAQGTDFYPPDYKSIRALSPSIGLIGFGVGGELRADYSLGKFMIFGSAGYKGYGARDSMITVGGKQYQQVILSDCKGPIVKLGFGIRVKQTQTTENEFVAQSMYMTEDAFNYYLHYTGSNENLPHLHSKYVMIEVSSLPSAVFKKGPTAGSYIFVRGNNVYVSAIWRSLTEIATVNRAEIFDIGPIVSSDFKQFGAIGSFMLINHHFFYSMGLGLVRRIGNPSNIHDPFEGDGSYKWNVPFKFTVGCTFIRHKKASDFVRKTK